MPAGARAPRGSSKEFIFFLQVVYLVALGVFAVAYRVHWIEPRRSFFGPVPFLVPWFGAVGATLLSLSAVFDKRGRDWDVDYRFWHWARPLVGAIVATITVLILQSGILAVGGVTPNKAPAGTAKNLLYFVFAFVVGYREEIFRSLIKRLADVILTPPPGAESPAAKKVPGAPTGVSAVARDSAADVRFTPPADDGGAAITSYTVTATGGAAPTTATGTASPIAVEGLTNDTQYTFTVHAENAVGAGEESAASDTVTPRAATVPGAPTGVSAVARDGAADVSFTPPADTGGAAITTYTVTATGGEAPATATGAASPITVNGLANGTQYTFTVHAENAAGAGEESAASDPVTPSA